MQLIQELTLIQKTGAFIGVPLILLLLLVAARRRRTAAAAGDPAAATPRDGRGRRAKSEPAIPRRKRRKLAAETAHAMGGPTTAPQPVAVQASVPVAEPVAITADQVVSQPAEAPVVQPPPVPAVPAPVEDPYVRDTTFAVEQVEAFAQETRPEVVVAAPGWPTPGELASSFDPDAFDPLPSAAEAAEHESHDEPVADDREPEQPTGIIEMPAVDDSGDDEPEMDGWDGEFDPATGWVDDEAPVPVAVAVEAEDWYDSQHPSAGPASSIHEPNPVALEQFWGEAENDDSWPDSPEIEVITDMSAPNAESDESVPAWVDDDDETAAWGSENPTDLSVPFPAPGSLPAHDVVPAGWTMATPAQGSPVVLDLAGLAASGHSLELVIEANGDGNGVRLRFGSPGAVTAATASPRDAESEPAIVDETEIEAPIGVPATAEEPELTAADETEVAGHVDDPQPVAVEFDVPFLTGGMPESEIAHVAMTGADLAVEAPVIDVPGEAPHLEIAADEPAADAHPGELPAGEAPAIAELEPSDDPVQILADIRARLAALDGRR
jgi:hypothetical protein